MDGHRMDDKTKKMINDSGGKSFVQRLNGENFEFIQDPWGGLIRRSLRNGKYWFTYQGVDYYFHKDFKVWVNPKTNVSFNDEHPGIVEKAQLKQAELIANMQQQQQNQQQNQKQPHMNGVVTNPPHQHANQLPQSVLNSNQGAKTNQITHATSLQINSNQPMVRNPPIPAFQNTIANPIQAPQKTTANSAVGQPITNALTIANSDTKFGSSTSATAKPLDSSFPSAPVG